MKTYIANCFTADIDTEDKQIDKLSDEIERIGLCFLTNEDNEYQNVDREEPWTLSNNIIRSRRYYKTNAYGSTRVKVSIFWTCVKTDSSYKLALRIKLYIVSTTRDSIEEQVKTYADKLDDAAFYLWVDFLDALRVNNIGRHDCSEMQYTTDNEDELWDNKANTALEDYYTNLAINNVLKEAEHDKD